jgi:signal transduction histidine kinase
MKSMYKLLFFTREKDAANKLRAIILLSITYLIIAGAISILMMYYLNDFIRSITGRSTTYVSLTAIFVCVISNILIRFGRIEQAGLFLSVGMIPAIGFDNPKNLVSTASGTAFLLPIMIAGVSNDSRAIIIVTMICESLVIFFANIYGWLETTFDTIFITSLVALIFSLVVKTMHTALQEMRGKITLELDLQAEQLRSLQAEEKAHFIGSIAHDVRGPIRAADELLQMYQEDVMSSEEREEIISTVHKTLSDVHTTITKHLKQSQQIQSDTVIINIIDALDQIFKTFTGIKITIIHNAGSEVDCKINLKILERALQNIILNSREAGATQVVSVLDRRNDELVLTISDNGPGYPKKLLTDGPHDGFTSKREGLGLGLTGIVKNLRTQQIRVGFSNKTGNSGAITTLTIPVYLYGYGA